MSSLGKQQKIQEEALELHKEELKLLKETLEKQDAYNEKVLKQARLSNWIALGATFIAVLSAITTFYIAIRGCN